MAWRWTGKKKYADHIIDNTGTKAETKKQVKKLYKEWKALAGKGK